MYLGILLNFLLLIEANFCVNCWVDSIPLKKKANGPKFETWWNFKHRGKKNNGPGGSI